LNITLEKTEDKLDAKALPLYCHSET